MPLHLAVHYRGTQQLWTSLTLAGCINPMVTNYAKQWKQLFQCGRWKSVSLEEKEKFLDPFPGDTNFKTSYRGILHGDELVK